MARELKSLNGLRFPACLIIFMAHLPDWAQPAHQGFQAVAYPFTAHAHGAMPVFFILSGLVLAHAYGGLVLPQGHSRPERTGTAVFMVSRIVRLFPLHLVALLLILPLSWQRGEIALLPLLAHLTLTQTFIPDTAIITVFNQPSWSLSSELFFALAFPLLLPLLTRLGIRSKTALLLGAVFAPAIAAAFVTLIGKGGMYALYFNPLARLAEFLAGMLIYDLWRHHRWRFDGLAWELAAIALFFASLVFTVGLPTPFRYSAAFVPACAFLIVVLLDGDGPLRRLLASDAARYLGRLAFGFYIIHFVVIAYAGQTGLARLDPHDPLRWLLLPGLMLASMLAAMALHYGVERPAGRKLRARIERAFGLVRPSPRAAS